jgi:VanZ family protein
MASIRGRLLAIWLLGVVLATLEPFNFSAGGEKLFAYGAFERDPWHFVLNMLLYLPLGLLRYRQASGRSAEQGAGRRSGLDGFSVVPAVVSAGTLGFCVSAAIEYLQVYLPSRDSSLFDVLANTLGTLVGALMAFRLGARPAWHLSRLRRAISPARLAMLLGIFSLTALIVSGMLQARTRLSNWDAAYPLLVANEATGDRVWHGRVFAFDITDAGTPVAVVHRFADGQSVALPGERVAAFLLSGPPPFKDASGTVPDLEWTQAPGPSPSRGMVTPPPVSWLKTAGPATMLAQRLRASNAFTLRIECATADTNQDGPARIISNSSSPFLRNFTLAQQASDLVFRLRTPGTGVNGYPLEVTVPGVFADQRRREILATYDGATLLVATAGEHDVSSSVLSPGSSVALAIPDFPVRAENLPYYELAYMAAVTLIPGVLIAVLGRTSAERWVFRAAWVVAFAPLYEATVAMVSGCAFAWSDVGRAILVQGAVLTSLSALLSTGGLEQANHADLAATASTVREALDYQHG